MEFVQLQINYSDWENPAIQSRACYEVARKYNKPVIIMEPVKGGLLAAPPEKVAKVFDNANPEASYTSWAIRFAASLDGVITVLSGMSYIEQMEDNLSYMKNFSKLTEKERVTVKEAQDALNSIPLIPCTTCNYCAKVCPENIGISGSFTAMNYLTIYQKKAVAIGQEKWLVGGHGQKSASDCIKCGKCEQVCPQHIVIRDELVKVNNALRK
jgi:predicted aldo/keto reductase-like oxidoreductase